MIKWKKSVQRKMIKILIMKIIAALNNFPIGFHYSEHKCIINLLYIYKSVNINFIFI